MESTEGHDAIVVSGEKEAIKKALEKIEEIYEELVRYCYNHSFSIYIINFFF
jgi:hypothetical protein